MNQSSEKNSANRNQIYWQCRRGMRELDILLQNFFNNQFDSLDKRDINAFVCLLNLQDQELLEYLMGRKHFQHGEMNRVVEKIRNAI